MILNRRNFSTYALAFLILPSNAAWSKNGSHSNAAKQSASSRSGRTASILIRQSDKKGGHFRSKHLAKPLSYLKARARNGSPTSAKSAKSKLSKRQASAASRARVSRALKQPPRKVRRKEISTFANEMIAQAALARAIERNRGQLRTWLASKQKTPLALHTKVPKSAGAVYLPGTNRVVPPKKAIFLLKKDGSRFRLHTGYLTSIGFSGRRS